MIRYNFAQRPAIKFLLISLFLANSSQAALLTNVDEIMKKSEDARQIKNTVANVELLTTNGSEKDKKVFKYWRKLAEDGKRFKTFTRFSEPATIKNQAILFLEKANYSSDVFLYLPTFKKVRRVESHSQSSSFMGSAFSYSDIATPLPEDYNNKLIKTESCPNDKAQCYLVESTPKTADIKSRTGYVLSKQWIHSEHFLPVQWEFYAEPSKAKKKMTATQVKKVDGSKSLAHFLEITDLTNNKKTTLEFKSVSTKENIPDNIFTQQNLTKEN